MQARASNPAQAEQDARVRRLLQAFSLNPTDTPSFRMLEEHLFLAGAWRDLGSVYEARLSVLPADGAERLELLSRLAGVLTERLGDQAGARTRYEEILRLQPRNAPALGALRRMLVRAGEVAQALQLAEMEESLELAPTPRAQLLAEIGELWRRVGEPAEARRRFDEALALDPACDAAIALSAALAEDAGDVATAIELLERRMRTQTGPARAEVLERIAALLPPEQAERARALLEELVRSAPERRAPLERLIALERAAGRSERLDELQRSLWKLVHDPVERLRLALEAATLQLDECGNLEAARLWAERANEVAPDDATVQKLRLRIHRRGAQTDGVIDALEKLIKIEGASAMRLLEVAVLHEREGRAERAIAWLERLLAQDAYDGEALAILDRCLARLARHPERAEVLERRIAAAESNEGAADLMVELGDLHLLALQDAASAEASYLRALDQVPAHGDATVQLRELLRKQERFDDLGAFLERRAQSATPGRERAHWLCELADLRQSHTNDPAAARRAFEAALESDPSCAAALSGLRVLAETTREPGALAEACERELALEPPAARAAELLAELARAARTLGDVARARRAAARWIELAPSAEALELSADLAREAGDAPAETATLEGLEALVQEDRPRHARTCRRLAELAIARPEVEALDVAARWLRASLASAPDREVRARLLELYRRNGNQSELAHELAAEHAAAGANAPLALSLELARLLAELGDLRRATEVLRPAFEREPDSSAAGDLLEGLLAEQDRIEELCEVLARRLGRERDPARRRELAHRQAGLLLEGLQRAPDAVAALREFADPTRDGRLEHLFARALEAAGARQELETWLSMREAHVSGEERVELLLRLASLLAQSGRQADAIACLQRARRGAPAGTTGAARTALLGLLRAHGSPAEQRALLDELIAEPTEPAERAALLIERARLLAERLSEPVLALADLERARADARLGPDELRLVAALCASANAAGKQAEALAQLAELSRDSVEKRGVLLQLARIYADGPDDARDAARAEATLKKLLQADSSDADAFDRLAALYERDERGPQLRRLFGERLALRALRARERSALALRLANLQLEAREHGLAVETLVDARSQEPSESALDELLFRALAAAGNAAGQVQLCAERVRLGEGEERARWLRRWLTALESAHESPAARLAVVDKLVAEHDDDRELVLARVAILRELGTPEALARGLERALDLTGAVTAAQRRLLVRELLRCYEGPLARPEAVLARIEREVGADPELAARGIAAARALGDAARELALLRPQLMAGVPASTRPEELRAIGLALARGGEPDQAYTVLCRAHDAAPRDREVLAALDALVRGSRNDARLLELANARFPLEAGDGRARIAAEAAATAARLGDSRAELLWLRRLHALGKLSREQRLRWLALERELGSPTGRLEALQALAEAATDPAEQTELDGAIAAALAEGGQLSAATERYARVLGSARAPKLAWLRAQNELFGRLGRAAERVDLLRALARHPEASAEERSRWQGERIELLASRPELREEAALELRMLIDADASAARPAQLERMRGLLALYDDLGRDSEWCALAERALALLPERERAELEQSIAARLSGTLASTDQAIPAWQRVLIRTPEDPTALAALAALWRRPGDEGKRADALERLAKQDAPHADELWLEAATLRWRILGDARAALDDVERAVALAPRLEGAHDLRSELCAHLDRHDEEAASLRELLAAEPDGALAAERWLRLAQLVAAEDSGRDEALTAAERALALSPGQAPMRREVRRVFERAGAFERARDLLREEIIAATPAEAPALHCRLARIAWDELHDARLACEAFAAADTDGALRPEDRERWAAALAELGRFAESLEQRGLALAPEGAHARAEDWLQLARDTLERLDDPRKAREACDQALARQPGLRDALALRAQLFARLCEPARELEDVLALAELESEASEAAAQLTRAAEIARDRLGDETRAWALFRTALKRDAARLPALLGAGAIALARSEWPEAERMYGLAAQLLPGTPDEEKLGSVARCAAQAALEQQRAAEAFRYLEVALRREPEHGEALDAMAGLALRLGAYERARDCLDTRLRIGGLEPTEHAERLVKLAQACEGLQQLDRAAAALEEVLALRPDDEVSRARAVDLLERLGETERAVLQLDAWAEHAPAEFAGRLALRAAQLELAAGDRGRARERLEELTEGDSAPDDAWVARLELVREDDGAAAALELVERALGSIKAPRARGALLWRSAEALHAQGQPGPAARRSLETLSCDPGNIPAARLLAANLGQLEDWGQAVKLLERALDIAHPERSVEAELWEAVGRAYAGPLEDIERAQRCYRRALECNPLRSSAREALADTTAFDPAAHRESVAAHRELLERHPARRSSWRSLERIAEHWKRERPQRTAAAVLHALGGTAAAGANPPPLLASLGASPVVSVAAATELLAAVAESGALPAAGNEPAPPELPQALQREVESIAGRGWRLPDAVLRGIWSQPAEESASNGEDLGRRARRRLKKALRSFDAELLRVLEPVVWREQILGLAAARLLSAGQADLRELLYELIESWPATAHLETRASADLSAAVQLCPPARALLLRVAESTISALGL